MKVERLTPQQMHNLEHVCTQQQLHALRLWNRHLGYKRIAFILHIHPSTAKAHIEAGLRKIGLTIEIAT